MTEKASGSISGMWLFTDNDATSELQLAAEEVVVHPNNFRQLTAGL
jgi:hypothetical protein